METSIVFDQRRSVNSFDKNRSIDASLLKEIVNMAVLAPSAFNLQPWRILVVQSEEAKEQLKALANNQDKVTEAPVTLVLIGNKEGFADENPVWE